MGVTLIRASFCCCGEKNLLASTVCADRTKFSCEVTPPRRFQLIPVKNVFRVIRCRPPSLVVADFGCGDCKIARSVKNKVHGFDLAATCELATVCDMANVSVCVFSNLVTFFDFIYFLRNISPVQVPLGDGSVDIAVFCLSLMGTNLADFLAEANRVLKIG